MTPKVVEVEIDAAIATVRLNRPERRNGMTVEMVEAMYRELGALAGNTSVAVVIVTGAGHDFCVGADIGGGSSGAADEVSHRRLGPTYHATRLLHEMPQVTIAAIDGGCAGAGLGWAAACDLRFASDRARFSTAFLDVGVAGDMGAAWVIQQAVGASRARELFLFPAKFDAATALSYGLVTRVVPAEELLDEAWRAATELVSKSRYALSMVKANFISAERLSLADFIDVEAARHIHLIQSPESAAAFAEYAARSRLGKPGR